MANYRNFTLTTYFVAHGTARTTREELEKDLAFFGRHMRLDKVYLEPYRGEWAPREQTEMCKAVFEAHGIEVAGGLTTVYEGPDEEPRTRMFNTFCYNDPKALEELRSVTAQLGELFDSFIIDDFFFTTCTCRACREAKTAYNLRHGITDGSWTAYRLSRMREISEEYVLKPARAANPSCRVTIKYPNWAESYQATGYAPGLQRDLFDRVYTGTETRDPVTTDQHLPRYLSFSLMTYFEAMCPGRNGGGWWDPFSTHITEHYLEQAYLTAFSKPKELMLFCFQALRDHMWVPALGFQLDRLDQALDHLQTPEGLLCYLPDNAEGEDNLQDFLGMIGLPVLLTPYFPESAEQILLTEASAMDPQIVDKLEAYVAKGGRALVTTGFVKATEGRGIKALTSLRVTDRRFTAQRWRVEDESPEGWPQCTFPEGKTVLLPVAEYRNNFSWGVIKAIHGEENIGFLFRDRYGAGELWTLAVPDAMPDLYRLPAPVLSRLREAFPVRGAWLEAGSLVSLFVYSNDAFVLYPYVAEGTQRQVVRLHVKNAAALELPLKKRTVQPLYTRKFGQNTDAVFELQAVPGQYEVLKVLRSV